MLRLEVVGVRSFRCCVESECEHFDLAVTKLVLARTSSISSTGQRVGKEAQVILVYSTEVIILITTSSLR
jgi:hypothetical protein